jgi:hypothetical protein
LTDFALRRSSPTQLLTYAELGKVVKQSKDVYEPDNEHNHHNAIQNSLDLALHGNEAIDQPKQHAYNADRENNCDKWHSCTPIHTHCSIAMNQLLSYTAHLERQSY